MKRTAIKRRVEHIEDGESHLTPPAWILEVEEGRFWVIPEDALMTMAGYLSTLDFVPAREHPQTMLAWVESALDMVTDPEPPDKMDLLEEAWGIIANAWGGDWDQAPEASGWKAAAERWRDRYHEVI